MKIVYHKTQSIEIDTDKWREYFEKHETDQEVINLFDSNPMAWGLIPENESTQYSTWDEISLVRVQP